jgi:hypothetical protein
MTPTEITVLASSFVLVLNAVVAGVVKIMAQRYADRKVAEISPAAPSSDSRESPE